MKINSNLHRGHLETKPHYIKIILMFWSWNEHSGSFRSLNEFPSFGSVKTFWACATFLLAFKIKSLTWKAGAALRALILWNTDGIPNMTAEGLTSTLQDSLCFFFLCFEFEAMRYDPVISTGGYRDQLWQEALWRPGGGPELCLTHAYISHTFTNLRIEYKSTNIYVLC